MKKLFAVSSLGAALAMSALGATWTGTVSDAMCGAKHVAATADDQKCAATCVKEHNAEPVFVVGDKVYKFDADSKAKVMDHVGHKVTISGKLTGDTVSVKSVKM
jgi:hypothetical protein